MSCTATKHPLVRKFREKIQAQSFPCLGAKSALMRHRLTIVTARDVTSAWNDLELHDRLVKFAAQYKADRKLFRSFVVVFEGPRTLSEVEFEAALWDRAQSLSDKDVWRGCPRDERVSADPADPHFSLSFGAEAFFVVGLHPNASRPARRFEVPAMVFNLHDQFEQLRQAGTYEKLRAAILKRDSEFAGSANPMLARHGEMSEARQYSGRMVSTDWRCPFSTSDEHR